MARFPLLIEKLKINLTSHGLKEHRLSLRVCSAGHRWTGWYSFSVTPSLQSCHCSGNVTRWLNLCAGLVSPRTRVVNVRSSAQALRYLGHLVFSYAKDIMTKRCYDASTLCLLIDADQI